MTTYIGTTGNDYMPVSGNYSNLYGADGNDTLGSYMPGQDLIEGGQGNDDIYFDGAGVYGHLLEETAAIFFKAIE